jgi:hypothetical protein
MSAHQHFIRAVRAHHDLVNMITTKKNLKKDVLERRRFLKDPHAFAKRLLNPPVTGSLRFLRRLRICILKTLIKIQTALLPMSLWRTFLALLFLITLSIWILQVSMSLQTSAEAEVMVLLRA